MNINKINNLIKSNKSDYINIEITSDKREREHFKKRAQNTKYRAPKSAIICFYYVLQETSDTIFTQDSLGNAIIWKLIDENLYENHTVIFANDNCDFQHPPLPQTAEIINFPTGA